jgi:hypothetical protein
VPLLCYKSDGKWWFLIREKPEVAEIFFLFGLLCWVIYLFYYRKLRKSGL